MSDRDGFSFALDVLLSLLLVLLPLAEVLLLDLLHTLAPRYVLLPMLACYVPELVVGLRHMEWSRAAFLLNTTQTAFTNGVLRATLFVFTLRALQGGLTPPVMALVRLAALLVRVLVRRKKSVVQCYGAALVALALLFVAKMALEANASALAETSSSGVLALVREAYRIVHTHWACAGDVLLALLAEALLTQNDFVVSSVQHVYFTYSSIATHALLAAAGLVFQPRTVERVVVRPMWNVGSGGEDEQAQWPLVFFLLLFFVVAYRAALYTATRRYGYLKTALLTHLSRGLPVFILFSERLSLVLATAVLISMGGIIYEIGLATEKQKSMVLVIMHEQQQQQRQPTMRDRKRA